MALIILSIIAVILESDAVLSADYRSWFLYFEIVAVVIFTIEYLARIYTASLEYPHLSTGKAIWKYMTSTMAIIDFLAILPFYIELAILIYSTLYPDSSKMVMKIQTPNSAAYVYICLAMVVGVALFFLKDPSNLNLSMNTIVTLLLYASFGILVGMFFLNASLLSAKRDMKREMYKLKGLKPIN